MDFRKLFLLCFVLFLFQTKSFSGTDQESLANIMSGKKVVYYQKIFSGQDDAYYYCLVQVVSSGVNTSEKIFFYSGKTPKLNLITSFGYPDEHFEYAFIIYYRDTFHFATVWSAGARDVVRIYSLDKIGKIRMNFESGSEVPPEVVNEKLILGDCDYLMVNGKNNSRKPQYANVFKWNGTKYALINHPSWDNRFK